MQATKHFEHVTKYFIQIIATFECVTQHHLRFWKAKKSQENKVTFSVLADFLSQGFDARYGELRNKLHPESCSPLQLNKKIICKLGLFRV